MGFLTKISGRCLSCFYTGLYNLLSVMADVIVSVFIILHAFLAADFPGEFLCTKLFVVGRLDVSFYLFVPQINQIFLALISCIGNNTVKFKS